MRKTCNICHTILEINENKYKPGSLQAVECPNCGSVVGFHIPYREEESAPVSVVPERIERPARTAPRDRQGPEETAYRDEDLNRREEGRGQFFNKKYKELPLSTQEAYTGQRMKRISNTLMSIAAVFVFMAIVYTVFINGVQKSRKVNPAGDYTSITVAEAESETGKALAAMLDSASTQDYKGEEVKVYRGMLFNSKREWPVRIAIKCGSSQNGQYQAIYYNLTGSTANMRVESDDSKIQFRGRIGETPFRIDLKYNRKNERWEGTASSNYTLGIWLRPTLAKFR